MEHFFETAPFIEAKWRQVLRLVLALYVTLLSMGLITYAAGITLLQDFAPHHFATGLFSIGLFTGAYFILVGRHLRRASLAILAFIILARLNMPLVGFEPVLLRDILLVTALFLTGGWFIPAAIHNDAPGRIRLTRIVHSKPQHGSNHAAKGGHAFAQSPDEMMGLFDQISEVNR